MARVRAPARPRSPATPPLVIREAGPADLEAVVALRLALVREEARSPLFAAPRRDLARMLRARCRAQLGAPHEATFLAEDATGAIGILRCAVSRAAPVARTGPHAVLTAAYVARACRRRAVMRRLLEAAEGWCRARGLVEARLQCTTENAGGQAAWEALGYRAVATVRRRVLEPGGPCPS